MAPEHNDSPLAQLREFLAGRFVGSGELEGFVEENLLDLGPEVGWEGSLANQVRDLTTAIMNHGLLDQLWPALRSARPQLIEEIDRLSALDWTSRTRSDSPTTRLDRRWLAGGAVAVVLAIVIGVVVFTGSEGDDEPTAVAPITQPTVQPAASETVPPTTSTTAGEAPAAVQPDLSVPMLEVTSIRAFNGDLPEEQSAIQLLVANRGDATVNVDRATFAVSRIGAADCTILPFTGSGSYFALGAELPAYSVPINEYAETSDQTVSVPLNPPRRFEANGEEILVLFDLDNTRITPEVDVKPPYVDERFLLDGVEQVGFTVFEIQITLESTTGQPVDAGTVVIAHPRLIPSLLSVDEVSAACDWQTSEVNLDGLDLYSERLLSNRAGVSQFCESPEVRGMIGANEQIDALMRSEGLCE